MRKPFYGLDFGTSNSTISIAQGSDVRVLPIDPVAGDPEVLPSQIYFKKDGNEFVGSLAMETYAKDNANRKPVQWEEIDTGEKKRVEVVIDEGITYYTTTIRYRVDINKPGQLVQALKTTLRENSLDTAFIFDKTISLEELIAKILRRMKEQADVQIGEDIRNVVLGRPVHYAVGRQDDSHVETRMEKAAMMAGFETVSFLAEPIAAALSYLTETNVDMTILVFDFGGGTLDFSIVQRKNGKRPQVIATGGLPIGGNTFNEEIMMQYLSPFFGVDEVWGSKRLPMPAFIKQSLRRWYELGPLQTTEVREFLKEVERSADNSRYIVNLQDLISFDLGHHLFRVIEDAKKQLSSSDSAEIVFVRERLSLQATLTRRQFEEILSPYLVQIDQTLDALFKESKLTASGVDVVVATGGSSLIPIVQQLLFDKYGKGKVRFHDIFGGVGAGLALADQLER